MTAPDPALAGLARRFDLPPPAVVQLTSVTRLLERADYASTTVRDPTGVRDIHLADSLVALEIPEVACAADLADLGSGAGFPGLPLAVALPSAQVTLVEASGRKCEFLRRAVRTVGLRNTVVECARAEEWSGGVGACEVVTARALAELAVIVEYAAPLLRQGGSLVAWKGARDREEERHGAAAAAALGLEALPPLPVRPFAASRNRHLHRYVKREQTPPRFPRRPGMARKRPLRAPRAT